MPSALPAISIIILNVLDLPVTISLPLNHKEFKPLTNQKLIKPHQYKTSTPTLNRNKAKCKNDK
jgi:hypothetical protein